MKHAWISNAYKIFIAKPHEKKSIARIRRRCKYYIITDLKEVGYRGVDWIKLAWESVKSL
jgi:hypothetical protein